MEDFCLRPLALLSMLLCGSAPDAAAQAHRIAAPAAGLVESGAPAFAVIGADTIGLDSAPTDIRLMPDGRLLVIAAQQLALGDGVRWEVFRQAPTTENLSILGGAVDQDGQIYLGIPGNEGKIVFGDDGLWRLSLPAAKNAGAVSVPPDSKSFAIKAGDEWFWHNTSGPIVAWRPGEAARTVGQVDTFEDLFEFNGTYYLSDRTDGRLSRLTDGGMQTVLAKGTLSAITCAQPYDQNQMLVGTYGLGLQLFDGLLTRPFPTGTLLASGNRINDLCATENGLFAAAVDNYGIVFFDRDARVVQVLDHSLDHRLSRVKRLLPTPGGIIWGLLDGSIVRVGFPSRLSHFEPLIGTGITTVHPYRLDGRFWLIADGKIYQARYDADGRLEKLTANTPTQSFVSNFSVAPGLPVAGTELGAYYRGDSGWVAFAPEIKNLRILDPTPVKNRWLYSAQDEIGWLQPTKNGIEIAQRISVPALSRVYNAVTDRNGSIWLELGTGRLGRIQITQGTPTLEIFGDLEEVPKHWPQLFELDGVVRVNFTEHIMRFNEASRRFIPDEAFDQSLPALSNIIGRPGLDSRGHLWITANNRVHILKKENQRWIEPSPPLDIGFLPYYYTFEDQGVVWMHALHRLTRYDPAVQPPALLPLSAKITRVIMPSANRSLTTFTNELPVLDFANNSLIFHFVARGNSFAAPVTFDAKLEGSSTEWVSMGSAGSAAFNRLKEGRYILHVRPRSGPTIGTETTLAFSILPPWYRTTIAYLAYALSALGFILFAIWLSTALERRENARLERLVTERTGELRKSNAQLASQVEEIQILTQAIVQSPIAVYITSPDGTIEFTNPRCSLMTGHTAAQLVGSNLRQLRAPTATAPMLDEIAATLGRAESWNGQLTNRHQDGSLIQVRTTLAPILGPAGQIRHHLVLEEDITTWLNEQQSRRRLESQLSHAQKMESIGTLAGGIAHDFNNILTGILGYCELARMSADANEDTRPELKQIRTAGLRAKDLVMQILTFSRQSHTQQVPLELSRPVSEALKLIRASTPATVEIIQKLEAGTVIADATQIHQIVVNLCTNAVHAMSDRPGRLEVFIQNIVVNAQLATELPELKPGPCLRLTIKDNGHGMDQTVLARIFDPFFTTKPQGEGTGLGLSIVQGVVVSHNGALQVSSTPEKGTTFELYFPRSDKTESSPALFSEPARGAGEEILLVDDEPSVANFSTSRLKHYGYRPVTFNEPRTALAAFLAEPTRFAAIVTDLTMPLMTGLELIYQARLSRPLLPVVVMTGYSREQTRDKLAALPHCILLQKPFSGEDLAHALNQVMIENQAAPKDKPA